MAPGQAPQGREEDTLEKTETKGQVDDGHGAKAETTICDIC